LEINLKNSKSHNGHVRNCTPWIGKLVVESSIFELRAEERCDVNRPKISGLADKAAEMNRKRHVHGRP
jgi:hypothetical protein